MVRFFLVCLLLLVCPLKGHEPETFRFDNGYWFNGTTFEKRVVYVADNQFQAKAPAKIDHVINLEGRFIIPPLADAHHHGLGDPNTLASDVATFLEHGIFYVKNPNNLTALVATVRQKLNYPESVEALFANGGITASGGHPIQIYGGSPKESQPPALANNAYFIVDNQKDLEQQWPRILAGKPDFIKLYLEFSEHYEARERDPQFFGKKGLNPKLLPNIVAKAHGAGLTVSVHVNSAMDFRNAIAAGVDEIAHLPLAEISADDARLAAKKGVAVVTTAISHRDTSHVADVTSLHRTNIQTLKNAGVKLVIGTDAHGTAMDEVDFLLGLDLFSSVELLKLWCETTAQHIFPTRKIGQFQPGYEASFIALAGNPIIEFDHIKNIDLRFKQGHWIKLEGKRPQQNLTDLLLPVIMHRGVEVGLQHYQQLRAKDDQKLDFGEAQLNDLGYALLGRHRFKEAIAVFQLNVDQFPHALNPYDSLAEALQKGGYKEEAAKNYRIVLKKLETVHGLDQKTRARYEANAKKQLQALK